MVKLPLALMKNETQALVMLLWIFIFSSVTFYSEPSLCQISTLHNNRITIMFFLASLMGESDLVCLFSVGPHADFVKGRQTLKVSCCCVKGVNFALVGKTDRGVNLTATTISAG
jgi:hypothetical protein